MVRSTQVIVSEDELSTVILLGTTMNAKVLWWFELFAYAQHGSCCCERALPRQRRTPTAAFCYAGRCLHGLDGFAKLMFCAAD
jgi:hypothetical protein